MGTKIDQLWVAGIKASLSRLEGDVPALIREVERLESEVTKLEAVYGWAQATLTALNVGDVVKESPLHLKLREVMIAYRSQDEVQSTKGDKNG